MKRKIRKLKRKVHGLPALHIIIALFTIIILSFFSFVAYTVYSAPKFTAEVKYVKTKDANLAYYVRGKGEPMVLLTGFGMTMQHWDPAFIQKLALGNQLIIIDYRGVGDSTGDVKDIDSDQIAQDVITVMDELKLDKAHILGWSLGSFVAQIIAEKYPQRVDHLILIGTGPGGEEVKPASKDVQDNIQQHLSDNWESFYAPLMFVDQSSAKAYLERLKKSQETRETPKGKGENLNAKIAQENAFSDQGREKARYLHLEKITAPTLLISGGKDKLNPIENPKKVAKRIKKAEHYIIEDAGHAVMFENGDETTKVIKTFLQEK